jgi:hypothetical protein
MSTRSEETIEPEPKTEEETEQAVGEEEEKLVEVRERQTAELTAKMTELTATVDKLTTQLKQMTYVSPSMAEARKTPARDPLEKARNPKPDATKTKAEAKVKDVLDKNEKPATPDPDATKPADPKEWSASKFMFLVTGISVFGPTLLQMFEGLVKATSGKDPDGIPDELAVKIMAFAAEKKAESAESYWKDIGDYIAKSPDATSADLILLLQFIVKTNPLAVPFVWPSFEEQGKMAMDLAPKYLADRGKFFTGLASLKTSTGLSLPRSVAAALAQSAIALSMLPPDS